MADRRHAIITCSDARCGDFLIGHWLVSLRDNVDLSGVDIVVLDYGLDESQRISIQSSGVICHPSVKDAHVTSSRFRDTCRFLEQHDYNQVLLVDGGDVIFQADIRHLFEQDQHAFRAACEEVDTGIHEVWMSPDDFEPETFRQLCRAICGKGTINAGFILAPASRVHELWEAIERYCVAFQKKFSDQLAINYLLHTQGFVRLESKYNFVLMAARPGCVVKNGVIHDRNGEVIPVVHNVGGSEGARFVARFGYGANYNQLKRWGPMFSRNVWAVARRWKRWGNALSTIKTLCR